MTLSADPAAIRLLGTLRDDDCLRAVLPRQPLDPGAPTALLDALARWVGEPVHAAIAVGRRDLAGTAVDLWGGVFLPDDTLWVRYSQVRDRRPYRLRGPGSFADLYRLQGRAK